MPTNLITTRKLYTLSTARTGYVDVRIRISRRTYMHIEKMNDKYQRSKMGRGTPSFHLFFSTHEHGVVLSTHELRTASTRASDVCLLLAQFWLEPARVLQHSFSLSDCHGSGACLAQLKEFSRRSSLMLHGPSSHRISFIDNLPVYRCLCARDA